MSSSSMFENTGVDLINHFDPAGATTRAEFMAKTVRADSSEANNTLSFEDMLLLMVTQLQNQTIDNTADTNDMMNQIISMTVMQAVTEMSSQVQDLTEANILSYSASLVGQTVTVPIYDSKGIITDEVVGEVTATGTYNGQRVIFIGDQCYPLSQILAIGKLPEIKDPEGTEKPGESEDVDPEPALPPEDDEEVPSVTDPDGNGSGTDAAEDTVEKALG